MTPLELNEILFVDSLGGHMDPKVILLKLFVWLSRNALLNILFFRYLFVPIAIQSIITWVFLKMVCTTLKHIE